MASAIYKLSFYDLDGNQATGVLEYGIADMDEIPAALGLADMNALSASDNRTTLDIFAVKGKFTSVDILGSKPYEVAGIMFVSPLGPPLTTILTGNATKSIGMQFNLIDSPGTHIGGALQVDNDEYWCFLGVSIS